jgi:G2/mitotic-specific cyclin 3/4
MHSTDTMMSDDQSSIRGELHSAKESGFCGMLKKATEHSSHRSDEVESDMNPQVALPSSSDSQHGKASMRNLRRARCDSFSMPSPVAKRVALGEGSRPTLPFTSKTDIPTLSDQLSKLTSEEIDAIGRHIPTALTPGLTSTYGIVSSKKMPASVIEPSTALTTVTTSESTSELTLKPSSSATPALSSESAFSSTTALTSSSASPVSKSDVSFDMTLRTDESVKSTVSTATSSSAVAPSSVPGRTRPIVRSQSLTKEVADLLASVDLTETWVPICEDNYTTEDTAALTTSTATTFNSTPSAADIKLISDDIVAMASAIIMRAHRDKAAQASEDTTQQQPPCQVTAPEACSSKKCLPANTRAPRIRRPWDPDDYSKFLRRRNSLRESTSRKCPGMLVTTASEYCTASHRPAKAASSAPILSTPRPSSHLPKTTPVAEERKAMASLNQTDDKQTADVPAPMEPTTPLATSVETSLAQEVESSVAAPVQTSAPTTVIPDQTIMPTAETSAQSVTPVPATPASQTTALPPEFTTPDLTRYKHQPYRYLHLRYEQDPEAIQSIDVDDTIDPLDPGCCPTVSTENLPKQKLAKQEIESSEPKPLTKISELDVSLYEEKRDGPEYDDRENHVLAEFSIYGDEIFEHYRRMDKRLMAPNNYMAAQPELCWEMRMAVVDWLIQLQQYLRMHSETLYLAVNVMDRFLSKKSIAAKRMQLVGISSLLVAAKYEETYCPKPAYMASLTKGICTEKDVLSAERYIVNILGYDMGWPGPLNFLRRLMMIDDYDLGVRVIAKYLLELSLMYECFIGVPSDMMAAAAYRLASAVGKRPHWTDEHVHVSGYTKTQLNPLCHQLIRIVLNPEERYNAAYLKYSKPEYLQVAPFVYQWFKDRS